MASAALATSAAAVTRLLIVEDDARTAELLATLLETSDTPTYAPSHVATVGEACRVVEAGQADVVVLDLGLPDANDLEALSRLRSCTTDIPVVVLTGRNDETLALRALQQGAEDYLVKGSVDRTSLLRSIRYAIERHRSVHELARVTRELQSANASLERLTLLDPLTDVLNRRGLQQALSREIQRMTRDSSPVLVLLIDLDDFKRLNESLGHAVGDVALKEVGRKLRNSVRGCDYVGRLGGDEFMMILPGVGDAEVVRVAERTRLTVATTTIQHSGGTFDVTGSVGAMMLTPDTPSIDELLARSQELLYRSKREGKNRVSYASGNVDDTERRRQAQSDMCAALTRGLNLVTLKQPIFRLTDETAVGYEFLSRYSNHTFEMPDNFFRICSERNVLTLVDHQCLRQAVRVAASLPPYARFHLNVFPSTMLSIPAEHLLASFPNPLPPKTFCLEISEQQIIGDPSYLLPPVRELRAAGLMIAMDDVGFGASCLESLVVLEPDVIKIDKRCVIGAARDPVKIQHLRRYLTLAATFGAEIVAEGIETVEELQILRELGVPYGQGYYWGRPA